MSMLRRARIGHALQRWAVAGVDLLFPPQCATCGRVGRQICARCAQLVTPTPETICTRCGRVQPEERIPVCAQCADDLDFPLDRVRAAALHTAPLREWIHLLKYEGRRDLAPALARYLVAALNGAEWATVRTQIDAVVPTPLHVERLRTRGYNQAELLARGLCQQTGLPLRTDLLRREKLTQSQVGLNAAARKANVEGAFAAAPGCRGLRLLVIDDVYTTGATLQACARALRAAGAAHVYALTLALPNHDSSPHHSLPHHSLPMHHELSHS